jgi:hypothetical protein
MTANKSFENAANIKNLGTTLKIRIAFSKKLRADKFLRMLANLSL